MEAARFADHYNALGLRRTATQAEIRRAYRRFVLRYHPDRNPTEANALELFRRITEAYQVLSNETKRREYDALLAAFLNAPTPAKPLAPRRPAPRPDGITGRLRFEDQQNPARAEDALWGAVASASLFPWAAYSTDAMPPELSFWLCALSSLLLGATAFVSWRLGEGMRGFFEGVGVFFLRFNEAADWLGSASPVLLAVLGPALLCGVSRGVLGVPLTGLAPAILGGALAGWWAAALGRAFAYATEDSRVGVGAAVALASALVVGGFAAFLITAATSDALVGARFFALWTCSGGAAAFGGASAALRGVLHRNLE